VVVCVCVCMCVCVCIGGGCECKILIPDLTISLTSWCYDVRFPELSISLTQQGADILTFPAAFTVPTGKAHWEVSCHTSYYDTISSTNDFLLITTGEKYS